MAFAALFAWATYRPHPALVGPLAAAWALAALAHATFHLAHLDGFPPGDAVVQTAALGTVLALPLLVLALRHAAASPPAGPGSRRA